MDILIKGMEMPRFCADCPFRETRYDPGYYQYEKCKASGRIFNECRFDVNTFAERLNDCPLIEIPTPHGRLIDANKLADNIATMLERNNKLIDLWLANLIQDEIDDAPTILEAEE